MLRIARESHYVPGHVDPRFLYGIVIALVWGTCKNVEAQTAREVFIRQYCNECHAGSEAEAKLDLESIDYNVDPLANFSKWEQIFDRVDKKTMPPASAKQPSAGELSSFLKGLRVDLHQSHAARKGTTYRRLNRREYQNTLNDLFGTQLKLIDHLPEDSRSHEFDTIGEALGVSMVQMQRYLDCIQMVFDESIQKSIAPPERKVVTASYAKTQGAEQWIGKIWRQLEDGAVVLFKDYGYPTGMLREANVAKDGWYDIRVRGYAFQSDKPISFALGATTFARGVEQPTFGFYELHPNQPATITVRAWIPARYMIEITPYEIGDRNNDLKNLGADRYPGPGLAILDVEVDGPIVDAFPSQGHHLLYEGLERTEMMPRNPADREKKYYVPKYELKRYDEQAIRQALLRIANRAFRRGVAADGIEAYWKLYDKELQLGASPDEAYRTAVAAMFCSDRFLYMQEPIGKLDEYALANRLSYFLHRTAPDGPLVSLASQGRLLSDPHGWRAEVDRLWKHPHSQRWIVDFTDAWLQLRDIEFTNPDKVLYPEFDPYLQWSSLQETRLFLRKLIDDNRPIRELIRPDFAMLNHRLAAHYGIEGVEGPEVRSVSIDPSHVRGGLLGHASIHKVTANGTNTSPVVRGVWVMERILGQLAPPPPPGVPGVEPDIRGALTLREQLDKHRQLDQCQGCHREIDPPGFALERFDPVGGWRDRFRSLGKGDSLSKEVRGFKVRYKLGPPVDASGELTSGFAFGDFHEFRDWLAQQEPTLARTFATKLLTFACGREMGFSDRAEIETIVESTRADGYRMRDLLDRVLESEIFRSK